ncbi:MAG: rhomboid family intramembrane serine protease [Pseudomonadota bacterium]
MRPQPDKPPLRAETHVLAPLRPTAAGRAVLAAILIVCVAVEVILLMGDLGLIGIPRMRMTALEYGAFWPGLVQDWEPNYPGQPWLMFLSHGFLHGGLLHLAVNMMTLVSLGQPVLARIGVTRFLALYVGSMVAGGAVFALLSQSPQPMVGASGALFGLAGALLAWIWDDQPTLGRALRFAGRGVLLLVVLNVVLYLVFQGRLAWQTHLGGFLGGWVLGIALDPLPPMRPGRRKT